jgi:rubrerythrin
MELKPLDDYRDALKEAIKREEDATQFYEEASAVVHQADQKALLKRLAIEEKGHKKILADFATDLATPPKGSFIPSRYTFHPVTKADLTVDDIFRIAIEIEEESIDFYARFLVYFYKTGHEEVFKKIFDTEMKHKEALQKNCEAFSRR